MKTKKVKDVMTADVEVVQPQDTLVEAAEKMRALNVGPLPVCDGDRLVGLITDRDIVVRAVAMGHDVRATTVSEAMTDDLTYCFEDDPVEKAEQLMKEHQIRRVLVLNASKRLVGILSLGDLAIEGDERRAGDTLESVSEPAAPTK